MIALQVLDERQVREEPRGHIPLSANNKTFKSNTELFGYYLPRLWNETDRPSALVQALKQDNYRDAKKFLSLQSE